MSVRAAEVKFLVQLVPTELSFPVRFAVNDHTLAAARHPSTT